MKRLFYFAEITTGDTRHTQQIHIQGAHPSGKSQEICFFFKVREKSGNSVKWSGKLEIFKSQGKVREF